MAKEAEAKRAGGHTIGRPPSPAVQTKRRYEATPSIASGAQIGRPLLDQQPLEADYPPLATKQGYTDDFPSNVVSRNFSGDLVAKAKAEAPLHQPKQEDIRRPELLSKPAAGLGPRMGFFREDGPLFGGPRQISSRDNSPHQHPLRPGENRFGDIGHRLPAGSPRQLNLGPPRDIAPMSSLAAAQNPISNTGLNSNLYGPQAGIAQARNGSAASQNQAAFEQSKNLPSSRQGDQLSRYSLAPQHQIAAHPTAASSNRPMAFGSSGTPAAETAKPPVAKRSDIMSLLNDDPPEPPPVSRPSSASQSRASILSPQILPHTGSGYDPSRGALRLDGSSVDIDRKRTPLGLAPHPLREQQQQGYGSSQGSSQHEAWLNNLDPRTQGALGEQRSLHQSPRITPYSVVPPMSGSSNLRMESSRPAEQQSSDHRRAFLGQLSHPGSISSPPPSQTPAYRSLSASGQHPHSRVGSGVFTTSQPNAGQAHQAGHSSNLPPSHPHSAASTPVSSMHHGRSSIDYGQRPPVQQQMHMQRGDPAATHREQDRERELLREREREFELMQQQREARAREEEAIARERLERDRFGLAEREPFGFRRPFGAGYGPPPPRDTDVNSNGHGTQHAGQQQSQPQPGQPPILQRPAGYPHDPLQRSYTPQPPAHQGQQQPPPGPYGQAQPSGHSSRPGSFHHHHASQTGLKPIQQGQQPPPGQSTHPYGMSHFRSASQDERH
jgi:hypothetical protein